MINRINNFDLIRLLAAFQVVIVHGITHLKINDPLSLSYILNYFPGVIVFFTISGFLITSSLQRNINIKKYFINRTLRIFPALFFCIFITILLFLFFGVINFNNLFESTFLEWLFAQMTFFQFYSPDVLKSWGVGHPNGALWTITVELQFYILLPVALLLFKKISINFKILIIIVFSLLLNLYTSTIRDVDFDEIYFKLFHVTVFPYLHFFLIGSLIFLNWQKVKNIFINKVFYWLVFYIAFNFLFDTSPSYWPINVEIISNIILSFLTISMAYSLSILNNVLKGEDISYGVYIFHMLIINSFVELGIIGSFYHLLLVIIILILVSLFSWFVIEKKSLSLKNRF